MKKFFTLAAVLCAGEMTAQFARGQTELIVNVGTTNISGTNIYDNTIVGESTPGNQLNVFGSGTVLSNSTNVYVGLIGSSNRMIISNQGQVFATDSFIGTVPDSSNNNVLVTDRGIWSNSSNLYVGNEGSSNSMVISNQGEVFSTEGYIGTFADSSNNRVEVTGARSIWSNSLFLFVGFEGSSNSLVISNQGEVHALEGLMGYTNSSRSNTVLVTDGGKWSNSTFLFVGFEGSDNRLEISNGGSVSALTNVIGFTNTSSNNSVLVTGTESTWNIIDAIAVGYEGSSNSLEIADNGRVLVGTDLEISSLAGASNNSVSISGGQLTVTNGTLNVGVAGRGTLNVSGGTVSVSNLVATNGANSVINFTGGTIVSSGTTISNNANFLIGGSSGSGAEFVAQGGTHSFGRDIYVGQFGSNNSLEVTNGGSVLASYMAAGRESGAASNQVIVGSNATITVTDKFDVGFDGSSNSLIISDGGDVFIGSGGSSIGSFAPAFGNRVEVTGSGSTLSNVGIFNVGFVGTDGQLTVSNQGSFTTDNLTVGNTGDSNRVVIADGGNVLVRSNLVISALAAASNNSVSISSGQLTVTNGTLNVGAGGLGTLNVSGGTVSVSNLVATNGANSVINFTGGTIVSSGTTISNAVDFLIGGTNGSGATFVAQGGTHSFSDGLYVGNVGSSNRLTITNDAAVHVGEDLRISVLAGASNNVLDISSGQLTVTNGTLNVGRRGQGTLNVSGGTVTVSNLVATNGSNSVINFTGGKIVSSGTTVSTNANFLIGGTNGSGAEFVAQVDTHSFGTNLIVGFGGSGNRLVVSNGGDVVAPDFYIGQLATSSNNTVEVTGGGSTFKVGDDFFVGNEGSSNRLVISSGGIVAITNRGQVRIGNTNNSSNNLVLVTGNGSSLTSDDGFRVGGAGSSNTLEIRDGGVVMVNEGISRIGLATNSSNNFVLVTDGGKWTNSQELRVGERGSFNRLDISNGGSVFAGNDGFYIGSSNTSSNNSVLVTGSNSTITTLGRLFVGNEGSSNSLTISNGATVAVSSNSSIGFTNNSSNNLVLVTGPGSIWSNSLEITIGRDGSGNRLVISDGGSVLVGSNGGFTIGFTNSSSNNSLLVTGAGTNGPSSLVIGKDMYVGDMGSSNRLEVAAGGFVETGALYFGDSSNSFNNSVLVTGNGSIVTNRYELTVGHEGSSSNRMEISDGGKVFTTFEGTIGGSRTNSSNNSVLVTDSGSVWSIGSDLTVGNDGSSNSLVISNGGSVAVTTNSYIGRFSTSSNNSVEVTGQGSTWTVNDTLNVGRFGSGNRLEITDGGSVVSGTGRIGHDTNSSNNIVLVSDGGTWRIANDALYVGAGGSSNNLVISSGGSVVAEYSVIGSGSDSHNNSVLVTGAGSTYSGDYHSIGYRGTNNTLTVADGGTISAFSVDPDFFAITIAELAGSVGVLNVGRFGTNDSGGTIVAATIGFGDGDGAINFNQNNTVTLSSVISGYGAVNQLGSGRTIITNNNTYTGLTTVGDGRLVTQTQTALGTSSVSLLGGTLELQSQLDIGSLLWDANAIIRIADPGAGHFVNLGTNNLTLTNGTNNFDLTGFTVTRTPTALMSSANMMSFSTNQFSALGVSRYALLISNSTLYIELSGIVAPTNGVFVASGTNTYSFVTYDENGELIVPVGADLTITDPVVMDNNATTVVNGTFNVPGGFFCETCTILMGAGVVNGTTVSSGRLRPGNSVGTLTFNGAFTQSPRGLTEIEVASANSFDRVVINGTANLAGGLKVSALNGIATAINIGDRYQFITATGGISGGYDWVAMRDGFRGRFLLGANNTHGTLLVAPQSYAQMAVTPNQRNVAQALNAFIPGRVVTPLQDCRDPIPGPGYTAYSQESLGTDRDAVSLALDGLTAAQYPAAFEQVMPTPYASLPTMAFNTANALNSGMFQRMWVTRINGRGFSVGGMNLAPMQAEMGGTDDMGAFAINPSKDTKWGTFVDGNGIFANGGDVNYLQNYRSQSGGVTVGASYKWNNNLAAGVYAGYQGLQAEYNNGRITDNAVRFGVFGTYDVEDFYLNALVGGAYHGYTVNRNINFGGLDRTATGRPGAGEFNLALNGGYDFHAGDFSFGPFTGMQYTYVGVQGFTETGAGSLNLDVDPYNTSSLLYTLGAQAAYNWKLSKDVIVTPTIFAGWQHEFLQDAYQINSSFTTGGPASPFGFTTGTPARDNFYGGVGATVGLGDRWQFTATYSAFVGGQNQYSQNLYLGMGYEF